jgi:hypothetical protein
MTPSPVWREPLIYHGTPLTPRSALVDVLDGRASCVSFYRPDDVEAVEAVCPYLMFRQRRVFVLASRSENRTRMVSGSRLGSLLRVAGAALVHAGAMGSHSRCAGRSFPVQRRTPQRLAVWTVEGGSAVAHGWADRAARQAVRALRPRSSRLGRGRLTSREGRGLRRLPSPNGGSVCLLRQLLASNSHDARRSCCAVVPVRICGFDQPSSERASL